MIGPRHIGREFEPVAAEIERGRLRFFAKAIGETDPVHTDEAAGAVHLFCIPESNCVSGQVPVCGGGFAMA